MKMASLSEPTPDDRYRPVTYCLACGKPLERALSSTGSLRCLDCRDTNASLDAQLVERWHQQDRHF
jgi:hypothetical protein